MYRPRDVGWIEVICGSMFSGKSEELIRRVKRAKIAKQNVVVFKPRIDNRYSKTEVVSHNGDKIEAFVLDSVTELPEYLKPDTQVVAIDEAQFFGPEITSLVGELAHKGLRVIIAGLDQDFRGEPFGEMGNLLAIADQVDKLHAICVRCGELATKTQRLVNGKPAKKGDPTVVVGAKEQYEARCRKCHEIDE